jgi:hypothetical protein
MRFLLFFLTLAPAVQACDLCAIYSADNALGGKTSGFSFSLSEQFIPYRTLQFESEEVHMNNPSYVDSSITHLVPGYAFSSWFGVSFNLPVEYLSFRRTDVRYVLGAPPIRETETGVESGIGDAALIGRLTLFSKRAMKYGVNATFLAGVKFPTGDASRIEDEVEQSKIFESLLPPGTPHDPLGHSISSVHQHMLALGSGSYDGIFGLTFSSRWNRWFFNAQGQYYLRTRGESDFEFGDELMLSGGPGAFLILARTCTLSLQANGGYDTIARDELLGRLSDRTGSTAWYLGPLLTFTWRDLLSANLGIDIPLHIQNNGFQSLPDYRLHAGLSFRF